MRLLRENKKIVAKVIAYDSPKAKLGVVVPKGTTKTIPKTATHAVVRYFNSDFTPRKMVRPVIIKRDTANKLNLL